MTNYERIKAMNIDEMNNFISGITVCCCLDCEECPLPFPDDESCNTQNIRQWLESEANQNEQEKM